MNDQKENFDRAVALFEDYENTHKEEAIQEALAIFRALADEHYEGAYPFLGYCHYFGYGGEVNYEKAVVWFEKGSEARFTACDYYLGICYYNGLGTDVDREASYAHFRMAAEEGNEEALKMITEKLTFTDQEKLFLEEELKEESATDDTIGDFIDQVESGSALAAYIVAKYCYQKHEIEAALDAVSIAKKLGIGIAKGLESMIVARYFAEEAKKVSDFKKTLAFEQVGGEKEPNAVLIPSGAKPVCTIAIDDFSSYEGLGTPIGCESINIVSTQGMRFLSMIFGKTLVGYVDASSGPKSYGNNRLLSFVSGYGYLPGDAVICGFDDDYAPLDALTAKAIVKWFNCWDDLAKRVFDTVKTMS